GAASVRKLSRLQHAARGSLSAPRRRADGGSDQGQCAARQGRRRGRHYAELGGAHERRAGRALRDGHRAHGHAGDAATRLERDLRRPRWIEESSALSGPVSIILLWACLNSLDRISRQFLPLVPANAGTQPQLWIPAISAFT